MTSKEPQPAPPSKEKPTLSPPPPPPKIGIVGGRDRNHLYDNIADPIWTLPAQKDKP